MANGGTIVTDTEILSERVKGELMRLIDADAIRKKAVPHTRGDHGYSAYIRKWAVLVGDIDDAPTVDAVPVVRCKDCKHCYLAGKAPFMYYACDIANGLGAGCKEDDFCSYGERRCDK